MKRFILINARQQSKSKVGWVAVKRPNFYRKVDKSASWGLLLFAFYEFFLFLRSVLLFNSVHFTVASRATDSENIS